MNKEVIDFRNVSSDIWPKMIWQKLFDVYRERDCDMESMIAMLVDYDHIKKAVEKSLYNGDVTFLWECDDMRGYEIGVLCTISQQGAEFEYFFPEK